MPARYNLDFRFVALAVDIQHDARAELLVAHRLPYAKARFCVAGSRRVEASGPSSQSFTPAVVSGARGALILIRVEAGYGAVLRSWSSVEEL